MKSEYFVKEKLYETVIPAETLSGTVIDSGITWEMLRTYKRFCIGLKPASNVSLDNVYIYIGSKTLSRSNGSGVYLELKNLGGVLECVGIAGNGVTYHLPDSVLDNVPSAYYHTANRGRYLFDIMDVNDVDTIRIRIPKDTTIDYTFWIFGLTKEE